jgi:hypothetical protein
MKRNRIVIVVEPPHDLRTQPNQKRPRMQQHCPHKGESEGEELRELRVLPTKKATWACGEAGCAKRAYFNTKGETRGLYCSQHRRKDMVNVKDRRCQQEGCETIPSYNHRGERRGLFCVRHKLPGMVNVKNATCSHDGCMKQPRYNVRGKKYVGAYCGKHRLPGMEDVSTRRCQHEGCHNVQPRYNFEGEARGMFCSHHRVRGMVNVTERWCQYEGCRKQPVFNHETETRGAYCASHRLPDMVDVKNPKCRQPGCRKQPRYNYRALKKGVFCAAHRLPDMVDILSPQCRHEGCSKQPTYNHEGETVALYCQAHQEAGMVNVKDKRCRQDGCNKIPCYNYQGLARGIFCARHRLPGMTDVINRKCQHPGCGTTARYAPPGHHATACTTHRKAGMIANPRRRCDEKGCNEVAIYGMVRATHCVIHKLHEETNFVGHDCSVCRYPDILDDQGRCATCDPDRFRRVRLAKQREVKMWLDHSGHGDYVLYDRIIEGGVCGKERPDFAFDCDTHMVVLEVDEDQHKDRPWECEYTRMINISQSAGMPTIFLRYNPDPFQEAEGKGRKQDPSRRTRKQCLLHWLYYLKTRPPKHFLSVVRLFFDAYTESGVHEEKIPVLGVEHDS